MHDQGNNYPFAEVAQSAERILAENAHTVIHQKFTCSGCGARQTMEQPNIFFTEGKCEECGHITDIVKDGCNFMAIRNLAAEREADNAN